MFFKNRQNKIFIVLGIFLTAVLYFLFSVVFSIGRIAPPGLSMLPLFNINDRYVAVRWWVKIDRFDVVLVREPGRDDRLLIKRIIGLPGETLELKRGKVFVNGILLLEPYIKNLKQMGVENYILRSGKAKIIIPEKSYFFMGDNRDNSYDSRYFGPLHEQHIKGKIICIFWPSSRFQIL